MTVALVPDWVCDAPIQPRSLALYTRMAVRCDFATREIVRSHEELAQLANTSVATIKRALDELAAIGAVVITARRRGKYQTSNRYTLPRERGAIGEQLTCEPLTDERPIVVPSSSPVSDQLPEEHQIAAAAVEQLPVEGRGDVAFQACLEVAKASCAAEARGTGRRIRNLSAYARPRAADLLERHRAGIDELLARGAPLTEVADFVAHAEADPLIEPSTSAPHLTPVRPRLPEFRQGAFDDTSEWQRQQPVDIADVRRRLADARGQLMGSAPQEATS